MFNRIPKRGVATKTYPEVVATRFPSLLLTVSFSEPGGLLDGL